jgi:hypothetical protein
MIVCSLIVWLALLALLLVLLLFGAGKWLGSAWLARHAKSLCPQLCRVAMILAFITGFAVAWWLFSCGPMLWRALGAEPCMRWILLLLVLLVAVLAWLLIAMAACRLQPDFPTLAGTKDRGALAWSGPALLLLAVALILWRAFSCCAEPARVLLYGEPCARNFGLLVALFIVALLLWVIARRHCRQPGGAICEHIKWYLALALVLALLTLVAIVRCCGDLDRKDYDLAMVGIWWQGQFPDESGAHLRWAFRYGLDFPENGFDLYRRESSGGTWARLNAQPIYPVNAFQDAAPAPGPMWQRRAVDRLHPSRWSHFQGAPFTELQDMLARPHYGTLFFVQQPDDPALPQPLSPYVSQAALDAYLAAYNAAGTPDHPAVPLAQWQLKPIEAMLITALDPEMARLLGLLYIDKSADPAIEYDYRVVGHWTGIDRSWTVQKLSKPNTAPLAPPTLTRAQTPVTFNVPAGGPVRFDRAVGVRWDPPVLDPGSPIPGSAGIVAVRVLPKRKDLGLRPCPASAAPDPSFLAIERPAENDSTEPVAAVVAVPQETPAGPVWPEFFFTDRHVDYRCYAYGLEGIDLFGRASVLSNTRVADVIDLTGPPPPLNLQATVYQRADTPTLNAMPAALRNQLFPPASTHQTALHVSWVWPKVRRQTVPDLDHFLVYLQIQNYSTFSTPASTGLWPDPANWGPFVPVAVPAASPGGPLPAKLLDAGVTDGEYFETVIFDPPMLADDDKPVAYGYAGVGGVDRAPFGNRGTVAPPTVIFARDFIAPDPPPIPVVDQVPEPVDKGANAALALSWGADPRYLYHLVRARGSVLDPLPMPAAIPACLAAEAPTCTDNGAACTEQKRQFVLRRKAVAHPDLYKLANLEPQPPVPVGPTHRFQVPDKVDASEGDDYLYAGRAIDRAGNVSAVGCPRLVRVRDFLPPRAPTVRSILGIEGGIRLEWAANPEADLDRYRLLRTADADSDGSLDRMLVVLEIDRAGAVIGPAGAAAPQMLGGGTAYRSIRWDDANARPVTDYRYRLVALDRSGNISELSASARGRSVDTTPPGPPGWDVTAARWEIAAGVDVVHLRFTPPAGDADATFRIQRREGSSAFWRPVVAWLPAGSVEFVDTAVKSGVAYTYRVQAMDAAGNVGAFGSNASPP